MASPDRDAALKNLARLVRAETSARTLDAVLALVEMDRQEFMETLAKADAPDRMRQLQGSISYASKLTLLKRSLQEVLDRE